MKVRATKMAEINPNNNNNNRPFNGLFEVVFESSHWGCLFKGMAPKLAPSLSLSQIVTQITQDNSRKHKLTIGYTLSHWSHLSHTSVTNALTK